MANRSDANFLELAVEHRFLKRDSVDRLVAEANKLNLSPKMLALKAGVLAPWQIQALKMLAQPDDIVPGYRVNGLLGRGGFGSVFLATQLNMSRDVALKTIPLSSVRDNSAARRFEREAKIIGQLRHPHIVAAYDFGMHREHLFLSLEFVDGQDLGKVLRRVKKFDEVTTWHIIRQTVTALAYAAELDVTHRDIKPGNLLVTKPPIGYTLPPQVPFVKVSDFGLACFSETRVEEGITMENSGLGTPSYVAPEQLQGGGVDVRADVYSLGATAFHLLTGAAPYSDLSAMAIAKEKLSGKEDWIKLGSEFSEKSLELIKRMSAYEVSDRVENHTVLLSAIDDLLDSSSGNLGESTQIFELDPNESSANARQQSPGRTMDDGPTMDQIASNILTNNQGELDSSGSESDFELNSSLSTTETSISNSSSPNSKTELSVVNEAKNGFLRWSKILAAALLLTLAAIVLVNLLSSPGKIGPEELRSQYKPDLEAAILSFDGLDFVWANFKNSEGSWTPEPDSEGGYVLEGKDSQVVLPCNSNTGEPLGLLRMSIGIRLEDSSHVTIAAGRDNSPEPDFLVDIDSQGVQILDAYGDGSNPLSDRLPWTIAPSESTGYFEILIDRYPDSWAVYRDSKVVGQVDNTNLAPVDLTIKVGGKALFESPKIFPMVFVEPEAKPVAQ